MAHTPSHAGDLEGGFGVIDWVGFPPGVPPPMPAPKPPPPPPPPPAPPVRHWTFTYLSLAAHCLFTAFPCLFITYHAVFTAYPFLFTACSLPIYPILS